ncbi:MAG: DUF4010 domain-containing protein, partial [Alphaproteobacteria bacterium]|nr:DUF4010 domain-containing protein [Alphaproteobacteria bacterium]
MTDTAPLIRDLAVALSLGLLIGLERGWRSRARADGSRVAGLRTFGLLGLIGGVCGWLSRAVDPILAIVIAAGAVAAIVTGYVQESRVEGRASATSAAAALLTLGLGIAAASGYPAIAMAIAAVMTLLLASRAQLHGWVAALGERDILATARFAILAGAILPFVPNARYGPYDAWNPFELWLVVVLVTGFGFAAYAANRRFGAKRGTLATAVVAGAYSSTAVTVALSHRLRTAAESRDVLTAGIALASAVMFVRVLVLTAILARDALPSFALAVGPAALLAALWGLWRLRGVGGGGEGAKEPVQDGNPVELVPALGFALLVGLMALAVRWAEVRFGDAGTATLLVLSGSFDVDAAIVTLGGLPAGTLDPFTGGLVLAAPVLINTLFKAAIVVVNGGWRDGRGA